MAAQIVSKYTDKRLRVGWTIRLNNGKLARITWIAPNGGAYSAKVIETLLDASSAQGEAIGKGIDQTYRVACERIEAHIAGEVSV